jgi:hypothetical protein
MNPKLKPFSDGIYGVLLGIQVFFQGCWLLAGQSDYLISDSAFELYLFAAIVVAFSGSLIGYYAWKIRQNKVTLRSNPKTKLMAFAEIATALTAFILFAVGTYYRAIFDPSNPALLQGDVNKRQIFHPYEWLSFEFMLLAYLALFISFVLFYVFLPKQVANTQPTELSHPISTGSV